jgi:hypothetical protein
MRASYTASDRVHSTLQKAVKGGNVLEKIKAFEMQAAAAQAESIPKLGGGASTNINNRMQSVTSPIPSAAHRALSPAMVHPIQQPMSPMPMQHESQQQQQQQCSRPHRNRYIHPVQNRRDGNLGPMTGHESRKGAHVLEPAHGDIILRRRTPSQKTVNDEDYTVTGISSMAVTASQGHHHRQHHHHRASASRSRHRQEVVHDKRSSSRHDNAHKKHQHKQKEPTTSSSNKTSTCRRWLKGRKETSSETPAENDKQDASANKSNKNNKNKKNNEKEKVESTKKATSPEPPKGKTSSTSDNNRVYGVPNTTVNEQGTATEAISPQQPSRIDEENESEREEEKTIENKSNPTSPKEAEITQHKECNTTKVERRPSKTTKYHQKLPSTNGEIISKIEDDTRFVGYQIFFFFQKKFSILFLDFLVQLMIMHIVLILMMMMMNVKVKEMFLSKNLL